MPPWLLIFWPIRNKFNSIQFERLNWIHFFFSSLKRALTQGLHRWVLLCSHWGYHWPNPGRSGSGKIALGMNSPPHPAPGCCVFIWFWRRKMRPTRRAKAIYYAWFWDVENGPFSHIFTAKTQNIMRSKPEKFYHTYFHSCLTWRPWAFWSSECSRLEVADVEIWCTTPGTGPYMHTRYTIYNYIQ